ncbi:hypothetical protein BDA96_04G050500 [Sorghum bicolor]|uniref:Uncharacterized protein n=2 Tax=Sorghum bicolor TaxID=4558 RepID=A0A1Z5RLF0_SORBI|nr:hypothetical protein BDA96_04G050500 [Sorghum bicolor]OQU84399.1 hypothetical protein SORBI_3004G045632 [Sorghum bicolor]OQU84401.1 hypothetical protein SORBI_3004G045632 [Sorghum bicolor]
MAPENVNSGEMLTREQVMYEKGPSSGTPQRYAAAATRPSQRLHQLGRRRGARAAALAGVPRSHGRTSHNEARFQGEGLYFPGFSRLNKILWSLQLANQDKGGKLTMFSSSTVCCKNHRRVSGQKKLAIV